MATWPLQTPIGAAQHLLPRHWAPWLESQLELERERIGLWLPVAFGAGIACWFALTTREQWLGMLLILAAGACSGLLIGWQRRLGRFVAIGCGIMAAGLLLIWLRAMWVDAPVVAYPVTTQFSAIVEQVDPLPARGKERLIVRPQSRPDLPPRIRLSLRTNGSNGDITGLVAGEAIGVRARLMPPPGPNLPGGYDFSQRAWFDGIGAVGTILGHPARADIRDKKVEPLRLRLSRHVQAQIAGSAGGIATALVTGDRGAISDQDAEAMRRSGLAHLLAISGLHVSAVVGFVMFFLLRLLALNQRLALRGSVVLLAAAGAALSGMGYTWLTGMAVPTLRACIAALLVLVAFMMGREALTLRLVAAGAMIVMIWRPESLAGPSFQLSFAAVTAIIALHESRPMRAFLARRAEPAMWRWARALFGLLITGLIIELVLAPIALFHFHKAGLYGALANVVAIPLTTFVIMPAEGLGLLFDAIGLGAPFWWIAGEALNGLIALAHEVAGAPGAVATLPLFPGYGFALSVFGGLWLLLWRARWRWSGLVPMLVGGLILLAQPRPDILITSDGRHIAARLDDGSYALLRDRAGDYVRDSLSEAAGVDDDMVAMSDLAASDGTAIECNRDFCRWRQGSGPFGQIILASRGNVKIDGTAMADACAAADVVISARWLPDGCHARRLTIDRDSLSQTGGLALYLDGTAKGLRVVPALHPGDQHPWRRPHQISGNDEAVPTNALAP